MVLWNKKNANIKFDYRKLPGLKTKYYICIDSIYRMILTIKNVDIIFLSKKLS